MPFELDPAAVDQYFHYQYVPEPKTAVKGVRKLEAGNILIVDTEKWDIKVKCYWRMEDGGWRMEDAPQIEGNPTLLIRNELEKACELIIRSDVPVGVALSGGLDSSAIAAIAAKKYPGILHAFSVGYEGCPHSDERSDAKALADFIGIPFHEKELKIEEVVNFFPELTYIRDNQLLLTFLGMVITLLTDWQEIMVSRSYCKVKGETNFFGAIRASDRQFTSHTKSLLSHRAS